VPPEKEPTSLVLAEWQGAQNERQPPGCDEPGVICLDTMAEVQFGDVQKVSGPKVPSTVTATLIFHSPPRRGVSVLIALERNAAGQRVAQLLDYVGPPEREACFSKDDAKELGIIVPVSAVDRGDRYCFTIV
jgi:hypothetical protein